VTVIIHFSEQVKLPKVRSPATYLPHPKSMFARGRTTTAIRLRNNGNVMLDTPPRPTVNAQNR